MEQLKYSIEDSTIAELLGVQNFSTDESAVLELVKNAYDAKAFSITLDFSNQRLKIIDDGVGMNADDIKNHWMHVGKSSKGYEVIDDENNTRVLSGSKGVGRFALSRLGRNVQLYSKKEGEKGLIWETDWNGSRLEINADNDKVNSIFNCTFEKRGTCVIISNLRAKWTTNRLKKLTKYLEKMYQDTVMKINIKSNDYDAEVQSHFPLPVPGENCKSWIDLQYNDGLLYINVLSDEFQEEATRYCLGINLKKYSNEINVFDEMKSTEFAESEEELKLNLKRLGAFSSTLFFNFDTTTIEQEKFLYKYTKTDKMLEKGVILYRNAFSISSLEGERDWLGLGARVRTSPAAATHPNGSWRVRENQLTGYILIDKEKNKVLQDLMNRQGIDENVYYKLFVQIILLGLKEFERYRQKIIRAIDKKNQIEEDVTEKIIDKIVDNPNLLENLDTNEKHTLVNEIKFVKKETTMVKREKEDVEKRYKYDVRLLNVLSTIGLKAASAAHEMRNDNNVMNYNCEYIIKALKEYDVWEDLNCSEKKRQHHKNVPALLEQLNKVTKKVSIFMNALLSKTEKKQFEKIEQNIALSLDEIKKSWERDYGKIKIEIDAGDGLFTISKDIINVIFDNLILNSIQQNDNQDQLLIKIKLTYNDTLLMSYSDNGRGLDKKYLNDPFKILEVHETTRNDGHGLGMWIVHNTINMTGGTIVDINGNKKFEITFTLGDK